MRCVLQVPKYVAADGAEMVYKLVDLQGLALYLDTDVTLTQDLSLSGLAVSVWGGGGGG